MKQDIAQRWTAALRSKKFKQATGALRVNNFGDTPDSFCCLGVLCELAREDGVASRANTGYYSRLGDHTSGVLPAGVRDWAGMNSDYGDLGATTLVRLNDDGTGFDHIADVIEENVDVL